METPVTSLPSGVVSAAATSTIPGQTPDVPQTIVATTNVSGVDELIAGTWISKGLYSINPNQLPGTVWAIWPCHPSQVNTWTNHVYQMFNAWNGGFKMRARCVATSAFGGSFRLAKLPPNLTADQIQNMTLANFSVFPFVELDPQMPVYVGLECYDERNVMFHYSGPFNDKDRNSFGGWIVGYVVSPLIMSSDGSSSLNIEVDMTGDFTFAQPNPFFSSVANDTTVFPSYVSDDLLGQGGCDAPIEPNSAAIVIYPIETLVTTGGVLMGQAGRKQPWGYFTEDFFGPTDYRTAALNGAINCLSGNWPDTYKALPDGEIDTKQWVCTSSSAASAYPGLTVESYNNIILRSAAGDNIVHSGANYIYVDPSSTGVFSPSVGDEGVDDLTDMYFSVGGGANGLEYGTPINPVAKFCTGNDGKAQNYDVMNLTVMTFEAPMWFCDQNSRSMSLQPRKVADYLNSPEFTKIGDTTSLVFLLVDMITGQKYRYVRLSPNGIFSTVFDGDAPSFISTFNPIALQYFTTIPISSPLPQATREMRESMRKVKALNLRLARKKCSWNRFRREMGRKI